MSQENVALARDAIAAVNRGAIEAVLEYYDASIEWVTPSGAIDDHAYIGHDGVRELWSEWMEQFDKLQIDVERVVDLAEDRVLVLGYQRGRIKGTDHELEQQIAYDGKVRDRKVTRVRVYFSWDQALEAVNLDLVRSIYADWERGDWSSAAWAHPEIEYVMVDEPGSTTYKGVAAMGEAWRAFLSAWVDYRIEPEEYRALDEGRVLVLVKASGRGKASGIEVSQSTRGGANLFHIRDGVVVRLDAYFDRDRALADLSLES